ncbi:MAG: Gfo/Idh/MocA family oxidoreductase [Verrucomicrobiales bacterium]|nr:Gfo/Idh/MocA family oxidoreductase [Verrucomicrobiales bacterium]
MSSAPTKPHALRLGIIGCGNVLSAYRASLDSLRNRHEAEVRIACGRAAQQDYALAELGPVAFVTDAQAVIESPDVDLVLVLTSMEHHATWARAALQAGKHVVVEKPMATRMEDANQLIDLARASQRLLVCAPFTPLSPTYQILAQRVRQGDIGKPCSARARYGWAGPSWNEWFYRPGGGCLFDLGVYCLTSLTGLLGPALRVTAMAGIAIPEREVKGRTIRVEAEDNAQVILDFGGGAFASITTGFTIQQYRTPALEIYGTNGTLQMMGDDWDPDGYELWQNSMGSWQIFKETSPDWSWTDGLRHAVECIRKGQRPIITPEHSRHVLEIMLKARQAASEGRTQPLETTFPPLNLELNPPAVATDVHLVHDRTRPHRT